MQAAHQTLRRLFTHLSSMKPLAEGFVFRFDQDTIVVAHDESVVAVVSEEGGMVELSFDHGCPYGRKIALVKLMRKAAPDNTIVVGPDVTILQLALDTPAEFLKF